MMRHVHPMSHRPQLTTGTRFMALRKLVGVGLSEDRRSARCPLGVTTVAQVLPFIDFNGSVPAGRGGP